MLCRCVHHTSLTALGGADDKYQNRLGRFLQQPPHVEASWSREGSFFKTQSETLPRCPYRHRIWLQPTRDYNAKHVFSSNRIRGSLTSFTMRVTGRILKVKQLRMGFFVQAFETWKQRTFTCGFQMDVKRFRLSTTVWIGMLDVTGSNSAEPSVPHRRYHTDLENCSISRQCLARPWNRKNLLRVA